jgi:hypothetical protein
MWAWRRGSRGGADFEREPMWEPRPPAKCRFTNRPLIQQSHQRLGYLLSIISVPLRSIGTDNFHLFIIHIICACNLVTSLLTCLRIANGIANRFRMDLQGMGNPSKWKAYIYLANVSYRVSSSSQAIQIISSSTL